MEYVNGVFILLLIVWLVWPGTEQKDSASRLKRLEAKVDLLLEQAGLEFNPLENGQEEVLELLQQGQKIQAIKLYREITGVGLKEAKDEVEEMARQRGF